MQDANYNIMGLVEESDRLVERDEYTPYGRRQVFAQPWYRADFDRDGDVDAFDLGLWQTAFEAPACQALKREAPGP